MQAISKKISELKLDPKNARKHSEKNMSAIKGSLLAFGQQKPVVITKDGTIVAGNGTVSAAKELGWPNIDVVITELKKRDAKAYALADNRSAELAEWDDDVLGKTLLELQEENFDIESIGFEIQEVIDEQKDATEDDVPEVAQNIHNVQRGQIWQLGAHRLMCGDSTLTDDVERLMNGEKADITFTSPPYNVSKQGFQDAKYNSGFESLTDDEYVDFLCKFTSLALINSDYVFVNNQSLASNRFALVDYQFKFKDKLKDILIWNKKICPPNIVKGAFNTKWEYVFCFSEQNKTRGFPCKWQGQYPNVIETESNSGNEFADDHKAGFPVAFPLWMIDKMDFAKLVYEPFCGTGTTTIACEKTNRKCYGMEIDPHYCSVIIERWQKYTGKIGKLLTEE